MSITSLALTLGIASGTLAGTADAIKSSIDPVITGITDKDSSVVSQESGKSFDLLSVAKKAMQNVKKSSDSTTLKSNSDGKKSEVSDDEVLATQALIYAYKNQQTGGASVSMIEDAKEFMSNTVGMSNNRIKAVTPYLEKQISEFNEADRQGKGNDFINNLENNFSDRMNPVADKMLQQANDSLIAADGSSYAQETNDTSDNFYYRADQEYNSGGAYGGGYSQQIVGVYRDAVNYADGEGKTIDHSIYSKNRSIYKDALFGDDSTFLVDGLATYYDQSTGNFHAIRFKRSHNDSKNLNNSGYSGGHESNVWNYNLNNLDGII